MTVCGTESHRKARASMREIEQHFERVNRPLAIVAWCKLCDFRDTVRKERTGTAGRGWGMREGNKQRGRMIQHIKTAHPEVLTA